MNTRSFFGRFAIDMHDWLENIVENNFTYRNSLNEWKREKKNGNSNKFHCIRFTFYLFFLLFSSTTKFILSLCLCTYTYTGNKTEFEINKKKVHRFNKHRYIHTQCTHQTDSWLSEESEKKNTTHNTTNTHWRENV